MGWQRRQKADEQTDNLLVSAILLAAAVLLTVSVKAGADEAKPSWSPHVIVSIKGDHMAFTRQEGFATQEECEAHLQSSLFMRELQEIAKRTVPLDENATLVAEPACIDTNAPKGEPV